MLTKIFIRLALIVVGIYVLICVGLYFNQEKIIFHPEKLPAGHTYKSVVPFEEINMKTKDGNFLNALLFKAKKSKGLIFYIHGNTGNLDDCLGAAVVYTKLSYDMFVYDFRGFGKSGGEIKNEKQFFNDARAFYSLMKERYSEQQIILLGYSIGTGTAAMLASENKPKELLLLSPYYNLTDMMEKSYPMVPDFILKYQFQTSKYVKRVKVPITIFHGKDDHTIYYGSSLKLKKLFKPGDRLVPLENQGHNGMDANLVYQSELRKMLE